MKKATSFALVTILMLSLIAGCGSTTSSSLDAQAEVKDPSTITVAWLPNSAVEECKETRLAIDTVIEKASGKKVEDNLTTDYSIAVKDLASGKAQLALLGGESYVEAHGKNNKVVPLVVNSGASGTLVDALYYSRMLVKKGNEDQYKSGAGFALDNIAGKKMSFVSISSTSGFIVPSAAIISNFSKQDKWKTLKTEDLLQGGSSKFFNQVIFGGSHQLSLVNVLTDKADIAAVNNVDVASNVELSSGKDNQPGAIYTVKKDAAEPFTKLAGAQFVVIKSIPVMNGPIAINTAALSQKTIEAITKAFTSNETTKNPSIFVPKDSKAKGLFYAPQHFLTVDDAWYQQIRDLSK